MNLRTFFAHDPGDSDAVRLEKFTIFLVAAACSVAGIIWAITYALIFGWGLTTFLPFCFTIIVGSALFIAHRTKNHHIVVYAQIICIIFITALIQWSIGGIFDSGMVLTWAFMGPVCALLFFPVRQAAAWFIAFLGVLVVTVVFNDFFVANGQTVSDSTRLLFFLMNFGLSSIIVFGFSSYYVNLAIRERDKTNLLLQTNLQQAIALQQNEKLATLGKLSAGVAHELNNPAAATQRGAAQLESAVTKYEETALRLGTLNLSRPQFEALTAESKRIQETFDKAPLDSLTRSDREYELETWLEDKGIDEAWNLAPALVEIGYTAETLEPLAQMLTPEQFSAAAALLGQSHTIHNVLQEIGHGSGRISEIVNALKSYTYMDQAPTQAVDINQGLRDTLAVLTNDLDAGITIQQALDPDLPRIDAYGSELNQVWTNILNNAIEAMAGQGQLTIRTFQEDEYVLVHIIDSGPGIPPENQKKIFDPFFTTKPPGQGTGLGLNICHNIIVQKHNGHISVDCIPGQTRFEIKLPLISPSSPQTDNQPPRL